MENKEQKLVWCMVLLWISNPILMTMVYPPMIEMRKRQMEAEDAKEREIMRNFKIEVKSGWLFNDVKYVQREKPLTDEELDAIYRA